MDAKKTKIICSVADNRCDVEFIRSMYESGMNVVRVNSAHASIEGAQKIVDNVRKVSDRIAILIDTKGPEVRLTNVLVAVTHALHRHAGERQGSVHERLERRGHAVAVQREVEQQEVAL